MEQDTRTFKIGKAVITVGRPTNRRREVSRKIYRIIAEKGMSVGTTEAFADIVAHTISVLDGWQPPSDSAPREVIFEAFEQFLDLDAEFTDAWRVELFSKNTDPVTSPVPLPKDAPPNS